MLNSNLHKIISSTEIKGPYMDKIKDTERLKIRRISETDVESIFKLRSAPETFKYVDIEPYQNLLRAQNFIKSVIKDIENKEGYFWCIELFNQEIQTYEFVGTICLWNFDEKREIAEVGYEIMPEHYGKGIATEALEAILGFIKQELEINEIHAITHELNLPSIKLLLRHGFELRGIANVVDPEIDETEDMILYSYKIMRV